ncbi:solute carrier family 41 member 1 [Ixodes scapularis]
MLITPRHLPQRGDGCDRPSTLYISLSGNILDVAIKKFPNMAAFQPLMNGLGGNLAAVHASRMSTLLHRQRTYRDKSVQGAALNGGASISLSDSAILGASSRRGFILAALVVPGHLVFMNLVSLAKSGTPTTNVGFIVLFCTAGLVQVSLNVSSLKAS